MSSLWKKTCSLLNLRVVRKKKKMVAKAPTSREEFPVLLKEFPALQGVEAVEMLSSDHENGDDEIRRSPDFFLEPGSRHVAIRI